MRFEFATAARIVFGSGSCSNLPALTREWGTRALIVTGQNESRCAATIAAMKAAGIETAVFSVAGEPTVDAVRRGAQTAREVSDVVIGFGGGSAIDAAKAIAALATNPGDPLDYLEVIGQGKPLDRAPLPFLAVPTTSGTGSEVTRNAVLGSAEHGVKASLRSPLMLAKVALVDSELTFDLPPAITATTGLDALTQLIEPFVSIRANAMTDLFCTEGMRLVRESLQVAYRDGQNRTAREAMAYASLLGGLSLANAGLGVVHGFAAPIGGQFDAPHGAVCAAVLPHGMAMNIRALRQRDPDGEGLRRYHAVARILTGNPQAEAEEGAAWAAALCRRLEVPALRTYGIREEHIANLAAKAAKASSMKANPLPLTAAELSEVAYAALEHAR